MNINNLTQVHNVNTITPDLKYSETTEKWTVSDDIHSSLNLENMEMNLHLADTEDGQIPVVELSEEGTFYHGSGTIFTARVMWDLVQEHVGVEEGNIHSYKLTPVDEMDNMYAIEMWNKDSQEVQQQDDVEVIEEGQQEEEEEFVFDL